MEEDKENISHREREKEKLREYFEKAADKKEQPIAKDQVELKHVETKKQEASSEAMELAKRLKEQVLTHDSFERLSNEEKTILETFQGRRLFLERIAIIANQSRVPLGLDPFKKSELEEILDKLISKGYINTELVADKRVYYLSERGKYRTQ
jgi:hypothetical protein